MSVAIQPAGNAVGRQHYVDTVENLVNLADFDSVILQEKNELYQISAEGKIALWGGDARN